MRNTLRTALMVASVIGLAGASPARAQVVQPVEFTTTFAFTAGNTRFPAGTYTVRPWENELDIIQVSNGREAAFVEVEPQRIKRTEPPKDEITFNRYGGNTEVLSTIWDAADNSGVQTVKSMTEARLEKRHGKPTRHSIASKRSKVTS